MVAGIAIWTTRAVPPNDLEAIVVSPLGQMHLVRSVAKRSKTSERGGIRHREELEIRLKRQAFLLTDVRDVERDRAGGEGRNVVIDAISQRQRLPALSGDELPAVLFAHGEAVRQRIDDGLAENPGQNGTAEGERR